MKKKIISLLLMISMLFSVVPYSSFAKSVDNGEKPEEQRLNYEVEAVGDTLYIKVPVDRSKIKIEKEGTKLRLKPQGMSLYANRGPSSVAGTTLNGLYATLVWQTVDWANPVDHPYKCYLAIASPSNPRNNTKFAVSELINTAPQSAHITDDSALNEFKTTEDYQDGDENLTFVALFEVKLQFNARVEAEQKPREPFTNGTVFALIVTQLSMPVYTAEWYDNNETTRPNIKGLIVTPGNSKVPVDVFQKNLEYGRIAGDLKHGQTYVEENDMEGNEIGRFPTDKQFKAKGTLDPILLKRQRGKNMHMTGKYVSYVTKEVDPSDFSATETEHKLDNTKGKIESHAITSMSGKPGKTSPAYFYFLIGDDNHMWRFQMRQVLQVKLNSGAGTIKVDDEDKDNQLLHVNNGDKFQEIGHSEHIYNNDVELTDYIRKLYPKKAGETDEQLKKRVSEATQSQRVINFTTDEKKNNTLTPPKVKVGNQEIDATFDGWAKEPQTLTDGKLSPIKDKLVNADGSLTAAGKDFTFTKDTTLYAVFKSPDAGKVNIKYVDDKGKNLLEVSPSIKIDGQEYPTFAEGEVGKPVDASKIDIDKKFVGYERTTKTLDVTGKTYKKADATTELDEVSIEYKKLDDIIPEIPDPEKPNDKKTKPDGYVTVSYIIEKAGEGKFKVGSTETELTTLNYFVNPKLETKVKLGDVAKDLGLVAKTGYTVNVQDMWKYDEGESKDTEVTDTKQMYTIKAIFDKEKITKKFTKTWEAEDGANLPNTKPTVKFELYADDDKVTDDGLRILSNGATTAEYKNILKYTYKDDGSADKEIVYTVKEQGEANGVITLGEGQDKKTYAVEYIDDGKIGVKNTLKKETVSVTAKKVWTRENGAAKVPDTKPTITFDLYKDGTKVEGQSKELKNGTVTVTWEGLDKFQTGGQKLVAYTVKEANVTNNEITLGAHTYKVDSTNAADGTITITNKLKKETIPTLEFTKEWVASEGTSLPKTLPNDVTFILVKDGVETNPQVTAKVDANNKAIFTNLDKYTDDGKEIVYTVKEQGESNNTVTLGGKDYTVKYDNTNKKVTNTLVKELIQVKVKKTWTQANNKVAKLDKNPTVKFQLYADRQKLDGKTVTLTNGNLEADFGKVSKTKVVNGEEVAIDYSVKEVDAKDVQGQNYNATLEKDIEKDKEKDKRTYHVTYADAEKDNSGNVTLKVTNELQPKTVNVLYKFYSDSNYTTELTDKAFDDSKPTSPTTATEGTEVSVGTIDNAKKKVQIKDNGDVIGTYTFVSWQAEKLTAGTSDVVFKAYWKYEKSNEAYLQYKFKTNDGSELPKVLKDKQDELNKKLAETKYKLPAGVKVEKAPKALDTNTEVKGTKKVGNETLQGKWKITSQETTEKELKAGANDFEVVWTFTEDEKAEISYEFEIKGVVPAGYDVNNAPFNKADKKAELTKDYVKKAYVDSTVNAPDKIEKEYPEVINTIVDGKATTIRGTWTFVEWEPTKLTVNKDGNVFTGKWTFGEKLVRPVDPNHPDKQDDEVEVTFLKGEHGTLSGKAIENGKEVEVKGKEKLSYYVKTKATWAAMKNYIPTAEAERNWRFDNWDPRLPKAKDPVKEATYTAQYVAKPTDRYITLTLDENYRNGKITDYEVLEGDLIEDYLYIPRRRGYIFKGWSYNSRRLEEVRPGDRVYEPTVVYAIWVKEEVETEDLEPIDTRAVNEHKAYMFGYTDGTVRPNGSITRAEAAALVTRLLGIESYASSLKPAFTDTPSSWYNKAINAAVARGIMKGYPDGRFRPNAPITRAEFTQMIYTFDNKPYGEAPFVDVKGHWAERAIGSEYQAKRIAGYPDGLFRPDANITRAEAVVILNKIFERNYDEMSAINAMNKEKIKVFTDLHTSFWGFNDMVEATNTHLFKRRVEGFVQEDWTLVK